MTVFRHMTMGLMAGGALFAATPALAQAFENVARLEAGLIAELGAGIGEPGGPAAPVDRRLKLAACPDPLRYDPPNLGAVAVRCAPLGWRIRVPLMRPASGSAATQMQAAQSEVVIRKGDPVEIVAGGKFFSVSSQAIAEQDGRVGGRIRVRGGAKNAPMMVEVVREGVVRIPGS